MKAIRIFLILALLFLPSFISATTYESYLETVDIESKNKVHEIIEIIANFEQSQDFIDFSTIAGISNLEVYLDDKKINCDIDKKTTITDISCSFENSVSGKHFLKIEFDSSSPLVNLDNRLIFRSSYNPVTETKNFIFVLKLPIGYVIPNEADKETSFFVNPEPDKIYSDGRIIILEWQKKK